MLRLYNIRIFSILAVIILHTSSVYVENGIANSSFDMNWWISDAFDSVTRWCVPVFVIISGYLLLGKNESVSIFFKKRASKILIPLIFWSLFYTLYSVLLMIHSNHHLKIKEIIYPFIVGKPYYHLWFVFMIPFLYLITPLLRECMDKISQKIFYS